MLIEMLIAASCASGQYHEACSKAMEAATKQYGFYQNVQKAEDQVQKKTLTAVSEVTGETPLAVVAFGVKTYHDKALIYTIKPRRILPIDAITTRVGADQSGSINLQWRF